MTFVHVSHDTLWAWWMISSVVIIWSSSTQSKSSVKITKCMCVGLSDQQLLKVHNRLKPTIRQKKGTIKLKNIQWDLFLPLAVTTFHLPFFLSTHDGKSHCETVLVCIMQICHRPTHLYCEMSYISWCFRAVRCLGLDAIFHTWTSCLSLDLEQQRSWSS